MFVSNREVAVGQDAHQVPLAVGDRHAGDLEAGHQVERLVDALLGPDRDRVDDHPRLGALDPIDFGGLGFDGEVLVDHPDAAFLGQGDRELGLGHGVHRGRDQRDVQLDPARDASGEADIVRMHLRQARGQEDIVEGEGECGGATP